MTKRYFWTHVLSDDGAPNQYQESIAERRLWLESLLANKFLINPARERARKQLNLMALMEAAEEDE